MRRYPVVLGVTAAGLAGILTFHAQGTAGGPVATPPRNVPAAQGGQGSQSGTSTPGGSPPPTSSPQTSSPATSSPPATAPPTTTAPSTAPATTTTAPATASATGSAEQYPYGVLSVRVAVSGSRIVSATVATLQTAESYSQQLADQVTPVLRREVLATQSARITAVSGATYTSQAYAASVQSALDKLHFS